MARPSKLDEAGVSQALASLPGWSQDQGAEVPEIVRLFTFDSYAHGALFTSGIALLADRMDHHPDVLLTYRKVEVRLSTHDAGGITSLDLDLAQKIDSIYRS